MQLGSDDPSKWAFTVQYLLAIVVEIFAPTYAGSLFYERSESLPREIFNSNWIDKNQRYKAAMMILVERTLRPIRIAAGSLFELNLSTLLKVSIRADPLRVPSRNSVKCVFPFRF